MKQKILLFIMVFVLAAAGYSQGDSWKKIASLPGCTARTYGVAFSINGQGYYGTGIDSATQTENSDIWRYDSTADYWTQVSAVPIKSGSSLINAGRSGASAFAVGGKGYIIGGYNSSLGQYLKDVWEYNPATNTWTAKNAFPGTARAYAVASSSEVFGKGYYGTGFNYTQGTGWATLNDFWEFNPATGSWAAKAPIPVGRGKAAAFTVTPAGAAGDCIFVTGGNGIFGATSYLKDLYKFDPVSQSWTLMTPFPGNARENPIAFAVNNKGYVGFGENITNGYLKDMYVFDGTTTLFGTWTAETSLAAGGRTASSAFVIGNSGYVVGGNVAGLANTVSETWAFSTDTHKWTERNNADVGVRNSATGFAVNGIGYITGGFDGGVAGSDFYKYRDMFAYNPTTGNWSKTTDFTGAAFTYAPSFVINNIAYIYTPTINGDGRFQLWSYDPSTSTWAQKATQSFSVDAFFVINNIAYGQNITNDVLLQYNPANNSWAFKNGFPGLLQSGSYYRGQGVAFAINGKGYYGLGAAGSTYLNDIWEYDPAGAGTWTQKADFAEGRAAAVGFSIGNYGYVGTGITSTAYGTNSFYRFDPVANTWTKVAGLIGGPRQISSAFVINNKAYVGAGDDDYTYSNNPAGTHKDFYEYTPASFTLPVSLLNFTATKQNQNVLLTWQTAQEFNTAYFNIQRSTDGQTFENIGKVTAAGNSEKLITYNYTDVMAKWTSTKMYYRIQEADKDGKATLSNVAAVAINNNNTFSIYPNPVKDVVYIQAAGIKSIIVVDNAGREVIKTTAAGNTIYGINVAALTAGKYVIKTIDAKGNVQTANMLKQ